MGNDLVYQYLWRDHSLPPLKGWLITLSDNQAIVLVAFITTLVAFSQTRSWVTIRRLLFRFTRPANELPRDDFFAKRISQSQAVQVLFGQRIRGLELETVPAAYGVLAILNFAFFIALGVALPWSLTGGIEAPWVRSKASSTCIGYDTRYDAKTKSTNLALGHYKECWWNRPLEPSTCDIMTRVVNARLPIKTSRAIECPFDPSICNQQHAPVRIEYEHITPRDVGINTPALLYSNHRLTCSPLVTEELLRPSPSSAKFVAFVDFGRESDEPAGHPVDSSFLVLLSSHNGPNRYSNESSGRIAATSNWPSRLEIMPPVDERSDLGKNALLSSRLQRNDSAVFIIIMYQGRTYYDEPIDDPFLGAHEPCYNDSSHAENPIYCPDHEMTAIGCAEQFQTCWTPSNGPRKCTPWEPTYAYRSSSTLADLYNAIHASGDRESAHELLRVFARLRDWSGVRSYLDHVRGPKALLASTIRMLENAGFSPSPDHWVSELTAWMEIGLLTTRFMFLGMLEGDQLASDDVFAPVMRRNCERVLFRDPSYTNFYCIPLVSTATLLALLSALSYSIVLNPLRATALALTGLSRILKTYLTQLWQGISRVCGSMPTKLEQSLTAFAAGCRHTTVTTRSWLTLGLNELRARVWLRFPSLSMAVTEVMSRRRAWRRWRSRSGRGSSVGVQLGDMTS